MAEKAEKSKGVRKLSGLMEKRSFVFVFSLLIAMVAWILVSMNQTNEVEKVFPNVKVQINVEGSLPANNNLKIFGGEDYYTDVTVKGKSYLVNDASFTEHLSVIASLSAVNAAGTYSLPLTASIVGYSENDVSVVQMSKSSVSAYFDEESERAFDLTEEIIQGEGFSLPEGYKLENARLSADSVTLTGPALTIGRITAVKAVATLDKAVTDTQTLQAEIVPVGGADAGNLEYVTVKDEEPVFITVPVTYTSEFKPTVSFTNMPKDLREGGAKADLFRYTVRPEKVRVSVPANERELIEADELNVGTVDFSQINNTVNEIPVSVEESAYAFEDGVTGFTVSVDMSGMDKRWLEIPVSTEGVKLPENAELLTKTVQSVQIVGPAESVGGIDAGEAYAVPLLDGVELQSGVNTVPAKIVLRTLTDSWARGSYSVEIRVN